MTAAFDSCRIEELCADAGGSVALLRELRDKLRDWVDLQPHLPRGVPGPLLENVLLYSKFSVEEAKSLLEIRFTIPNLMPKLFDDRDPLHPSIDRLHRVMQWICLPRLTPERHRIFVMRILNDDASLLDHVAVTKYAMMVHDICSEEVRALGDCYVYDLSNVRLAHVARVTPVMLKKLEFVWMKMYKVRVRGIHLLNAPDSVGAIVTLLKSTMKPTIFKMVNIHSSYESLYKSLPKSLLPADYGGEQPSMAALTEIWRGKVEGRRGWFVQQQKMRADESFRPAPLQNPDELFGCPGSFRKIEID